MGKMIDADKLLEWLQHKADTTDSWVEKVLLENMVMEEVKSGTFDPTPEVPDIKPEVIDNE